MTKRKQLPKKPAKLANPESFGELFYQMRILANETQAEAAAALEITQGSLSKIENDESYPGVIVWLRFEDRVAAKGSEDSKSVFAKFRKRVRLS